MLVPGKRALNKTDDVTCRKLRRPSIHEKSIYYFYIGA